MKAYGNRLLLTALCTCSAAVAANQTATLATVEGSVLVNQHGRYEAAVGGMTLNAGDRLLVMQNGKALISYPTGCQLTLPSNSVSTVEGADACRTAELAAANSAEASSPNQAGADGPKRSVADALIQAGAGISSSTAKGSGSSEDAELPTIGF